MKGYEIKYGGKEALGLVDRLTKDINYFLKETEILESIEGIISDFISNSIKGLNGKTKRGNVWLNRFNARESGQDAFYIEFNPTEEEQEKVRFVQAVVAEGRFLTKEIIFREKSGYFQDDLPYFGKETIPFLKNIFMKFGFKILKEGELFSFK